MIRTLTAEEFPRLKDVADGFVPDPNTSMVVVSEENGEITARMILLSMIHIEGTWVREDKRGTTLAFRMMKRTLEEARKAGLGTVLAYTEAKNKSIRRYMKWLKFSRSPVFVWAKDITCQS